MQIFGQAVETREILIAAAGVAGLGVCYVGYNYFSALKRQPTAERSYFGKEDLELPLTLESEYGDFRKTCELADPIISAYLKELPDAWFRFDQDFLDLISEHFQKRNSPTKRALVIGCGTGHLPFEVAKTFTEVIGVDISFTKVITCFKFQNHTAVTYHFPLEGSYRTTSRTIKLAESTVRPLKQRRGTRGDNIEFINANPSFEIPRQLGRFQGVILPNSLNDQDDPEGLIRRLYRFVEPEGLLFISSDYNWKRITNQHEGFGAVEVTNSFEFLRAVLNEHFTLIDEKNLTRVFPESLRSSRISTCHITVWRRAQVDA